ncbi:DUF2490 domain-containing protein [Candidatus Neptunochlamydia vexilliferae]|uniref:DUF2490 domain-containing protein n=1 Tax=Candidatus Neptunichlamydia vexilliferae TaxID=1651774 RepID=UPI00189133C1|nr:DUF2490 domain-containing protein [Candidatus Neptunochlamydia vexilliferae]
MELVKFFILTFLPCLLFGAINSPGDFQVWNSDKISIEVANNIYLSGEAEFRFGNDAKSLYYKHFQTGFTFIRSKHVVVQTIYRQTYLRINKKWRVQYNPYVDLILKTKLPKGWIISDRNRIFARFLGKTFPKHLLWIYRNRVEVIPPLRFGPNDASFYIANEIFWQQTRSLDQNRAEAGFHIPFREKINFHLSYMLRSLKRLDNHWVHHNVVRIRFNLKF